MLPSTLGPTEPTALTPLPANDSSFLDSEFRYVLFPPVYGLIFILGLLANIYVLFVIRCLREAKAMGEIRIYMTNLTIADLLFVSALPFWVDYYSRHGDWIYSDFMCRLTGSLFFINTYSSILFLGAISVNRYWAVARPLDAVSSDRRCRGIVICVLIWLAIVGMSIPYLLSPGTNMDSNGKTRCFEGYQDQTDSQKKTVAATHFGIIGMFFVMFVLVIVCNLLIVQNLLTQNPPQSQIRSATILSRKSTRTLSNVKRARGVKRRATQMLLAVVGVFILCFLPHHVVQGPWVLAVLQIQDGWGHVDWSGNTLQILNDTHQVTLILMGLNCILDPVVYYFATRKFRRFIMENLRRFVKGEGCSNTSTSQLSMDSKHQVQLQEMER
ncbi:platelet-activating factor receptor [Periophthalmus magnuspinnatus]|uniref:platelet-activating factor receptor n=1 Tax=Periophthalmus magnuspinnatus TaxID=409849 RepID=UPI00145AB1ED|nr:platelet-activating factor receptor [Periophthalmus magnuspinnatus]